MNDERTIIQTVFSHDMSSNSKQTHQEYLDYYKGEIQKVVFSVALTSVEWSSFIIATDHMEPLAMVETVQHEKESIRPKIREVLKANLDRREASVSALNRTIDLAIRILVMINIREASSRLQTPQTLSI